MTRRRWLDRTLALVVTGFVLTGLIVGAVGPVGTASGATKQADVVFVFDQTGSMDTQAAALKDEVENVADELETSGIDARYGLVTYEDQDSTTVQTPLSSDPQDLKDALDFNTFGATENASHGIQVALDQDFRPDAQQIIVVITDEDDDGTDSARQNTLTRLNQDGACLVSVSPELYSGDVDDELRTVAENADCGRWTDINTGSFTSVVTDLTDIIEDVTDETPTGGSANFEVVDTAVETTRPVVGDPVTVEVTVENEGSGTGTYDALLGTMDDVLRSEDAEIRPGDSHTFRWTLRFQEVDKRTLKLNHQQLAVLWVQPQPPDPLNESDVEVVDSYVTRSTVWPGQSYEVVSVVRNAGNESGQATVTFGTLEATNSTNGTSVTTSSHATDTVVLDPGEMTERRHQVAVSGPVNDSHVDAWMATGQAAGNVSVLSADAIDSGVVDAYAAPGDVAPGDDYDVVAVVHNADDTAQRFAVSFTADDGSIIAVKFVTVAAGETVQVSQTTTAAAASGTLDWTVSGETATVRIGSGS